MDTNISKVDYNINLQVECKDGSWQLGIFHMFVVYKYVHWSLKLEQTIANMEVITLELDV